MSIALSKSSIEKCMVVALRFLCLIHKLPLLSAYYTSLPPIGAITFLALNEALPAKGIRVFASSGFTIGVRHALTMVSIFDIGSINWPAMSLV